MQFPTEVGHCCGGLLTRIKNIVQKLGMSIKPLTEYTEYEAYQIIDYIVEKSMFDVDDDSAGEQCSS